MRPAALTDEAILLYWRNDPETRRQSKSTAKVSLAEHSIWMRKAIDNPNVRLRIAMFDGAAIGNIRANRKNDIWELSWAIDPDSRGQNLGYRMVAEMVEGLNGIIRAEVKVGNIASVRIVEKLGMQCLSNENNLMVWELVGGSRS